MAQYISKISTEQGDMHIVYNSLANLPTAASLGAASVNHTHSYSDVGALPKTLTSAEYGTTFPTNNLVKGRIFFKKV